MMILGGRSSGLMWRIRWMDKVGLGYPGCCGHCEFAQIMWIYCRHCSCPAHGPDRDKVEG